MPASDLSSTPLLDFDHPTLQTLIDRHGWRDLPEYERIGAIYGFVRDEISFGYNASDAIPASAVLTDGYGQCNTKTTLLMALLRGTGIACRFHGATIHKRLQKGVVTGLPYRLAPDNILHSWAEVRSGDGWVGLEGVILDLEYLNGLRTSVRTRGGAFLGYGVGTDDFANPPISWRGTDTAIQTTGINQDFGTFEDPDAFYRDHGDNLSGLRRLLFQHVVRHRMNRKVGAIRGCSVASRPAGSTSTPAAAST
ncbi:transglutaminase [Conexibacter sp. W3-3-2]|nr:transglutaminase family protein [Conexibacter sp. W3-3-2]MTD46294.1 transglutaminase [Conexibacter sp. W3-3-2]